MNKVLITNGIQVSVEAVFQKNYTNAFENKYIFSYSITIENRSPHTVQLLRRHWQIFDSNGVVRHVAGDGVVGQQPILAPGNIYEYSSWCRLLTEWGKMWGVYEFVRPSDGAVFEVEIPEFQMVAPFKAN